MKPNPDNIPHTPHGSYPIITIPSESGDRIVAVEKQGRIGISDSKIMGVLSVLGHDPISDTPLFCGKRAWWFFEDDAYIRKLVSAYYGKFTGEVAHLSFVRKCIERAKGFVVAAQQPRSDLNLNPLTIRRL